MKIAVALFVLGAALIGYAQSLSPYTDGDLFMKRYMDLKPGQSEAYFKLRNEMLTPKFQFEDYGITSIAAAVLVFLVGRKGHLRIASPRSRRTLVALAIALPFLSVGAFVFDLVQEFNRGAFPHWADSLSIPLAGVPIQFVLLLAWSLIHLRFLRGTYRPTTPLSLAVSLEANWWLLFVSAVTAILEFLLVIGGTYWYAIPGALWLYLYLSMGAVYRMTNGSKAPRAS